MNVKRKLLLRRHLSDNVYVNDLGYALKINVSERIHEILLKPEVIVNLINYAKEAQLIK